MPKCTKCGKTNDPDDDFCAKCGSKLKQAESEKTSYTVECPFCENQFKFKAADSGWESLIVACPKCKKKTKFYEKDFRSEDKFDFEKAFNSFICALLLSIGVSVLIGYSFRNLEWAWFLTSLILFTYWFYAKTDTKKRAWGITFIGLSIESFLLPIVMFIFTIAFVTTKTSNSAEALGGAIGGGIAMFISAILGGFLGIVFLIAGVFILKSVNNNKSK